MFPTRAVSIAVINERGQLLMGRRRDTHAWVLPGGHVEENEDIYDAARRELFEEAGIFCTERELEWIGERTLPGPVVLDCFVVRITDHPTVENDPDEEFEAFHWIDIKGGLPPHIKNNLYHYPDVTLAFLGLVEDGEVLLRKSLKNFLAGALGAATVLTAGSLAPGTGKRPEPPPEPYQEPYQEVTVPAPEDPPPPALPSLHELHEELRPIAWLESRNGARLDHAKNRKGAFHTAFGLLGLKPRTAHWEYTKNKDLQEKWPGLTDEGEFLDAFRSDPGLYAATANVHWDRLKKLGKTPERAAYAWRWGMGAVSRADDATVNADRYVQAFLDRLNKIRAEQVEKPKVVAKAEDLAKAEGDRKWPVEWPPLPPGTAISWALMRYSKEFKDVPDDVLVDFIEDYRSRAPAAIAHFRGHLDKIAQNPIPLYVAKAGRYLFGEGWSQELARVLPDQAAIDEELAKELADGLFDEVTEADIAALERTRDQYAIRGVFSTISKNGFRHVPDAPERLYRVALDDETKNGILKYAPPTRKLIEMAAADPEVPMSSLYDALRRYQGEDLPDMLRQTPYLVAIQAQLGAEKFKQLLEKDPSLLNTAVDSIVGDFNKAKYASGFVSYFGKQLGEQQVRRLWTAAKQAPDDQSNDKSMTLWALAEEATLPQDLITEALEQQLVNPSILVSRQTLDEKNRRLMLDSPQPWIRIAYYANTRDLKITPEEFEARFLGETEDDVVKAMLRHVPESLYQNVFFRLPPSKALLVAEYARPEVLSSDHYNYLIDRVGGFGDLARIFSLKGLPAEGFRRLAHRIDTEESEISRGLVRVYDEHGNVTLHQIEPEVQAGTIKAFARSFEDLRLAGMIQDNFPGDVFEAWIDKGTSPKWYGLLLISYGKMHPDLFPRFEKRVRELAAQSQHQFKDGWNWQVVLSDLDEKKIGIAPDDVFSKRTAIRSFGSKKFALGQLRKLRDRIQALGRPLTRKELGQNIPEPIVRAKLLDNKGNLSADKIQAFIDSLPPTHEFNLSHSKWGDAQRHNDSESEVLQVNVTNDHVRKMYEAGVLGTFRKMVQASERSGHPVTPSTVGWIRYTLHRQGLQDREIQQKLNGRVLFQIDNINKYFSDGRWTTKAFNVAPEWADPDFHVRMKQAVDRFVEGPGKDDPEMRQIQRLTDRWAYYRDNGGNTYRSDLEGLVALRRFQEKYPDVAPKLDLSGVDWDAVWNAAHKDLHPDYKEFRTRADQWRDSRGRDYTYAPVHASRAFLDWVKEKYNPDAYGDVPTEPGPIDEIHIDEIQCDFAQSFVKRAIAEAKRHGYDPEEAARRAEEEFPEAHYKKITEILFGGQHANEILHEAFHQHLRDEGHTGMPLHLWHYESKRGISFFDGDDVPIHAKITYGDVPQKHGYEPAKYGDLSHQDNPDYKGRDTWMTTVRKHEDE